MNKQKTTAHAKALQALHMTTDRMTYQPRPASISITAAVYAGAGEYDRALQSIGYTAPAPTACRARAYRIMQGLTAPAALTVATIAPASPAAEKVDKMNVTARVECARVEKTRRLATSNDPAAAEKIRRKDEKNARKNGTETITGTLAAAEKRAPRPKKEYPVIDRVTITAAPYRYGLKAVQAALRGNPSPAVWKYKTAAAVVLGAVRRVDIAKVAAEKAAAGIADQNARALAAHAAAEKACKAYRAHRNSTQKVKNRMEMEREKLRAAVRPLVEKATRAQKENAAILAMGENEIATAIGATVIADLVQEAIIAMLTAEKDCYAAGVRRVYTVMQQERRKAAPIVCPAVKEGEEKEVFLVNLAARDNTETAAECAIIMEWIEKFCAGKIPRERALAAWNGAARNMDALSDADRKMLSRIFTAARAAFTI